MRFLSALLVGALVAYVSGSCIYLEDGKEYIYDMEQAVTAGTMDFVSGSSGFSYKMRLAIQVSGSTLNLRYDNLKFSQYVGMHEPREWPFDSTIFTDLAQSGEASLELTADGLFSKLTVPSEMSVMGRNLARAIATQLQINAKELKSGKKHFKSTESVLQGKCDMSYTAAGNVLRKSVSHTDDCEDRVFRIIDDYRGFRCDGETMQGGMGYPSSVASNVYVLDQEKNQITQMVSTSTFVAQFYEEEGAATIVFANSTATLASVQASSGDISVSGETITDLSYEFGDSEYSWDKDRDLKAVEPLFSTGRVNNQPKAEVIETLKSGLAYQKTIIENIKSGISREDLNKAHRYGINNLLPAFMALDYDGLKSLADELLADKSDSGVTMSNVFNELLASTGTTAAALVVRDLAIEGKFDTDRDAARCLTGVPFHIRRPNKQLIEEYKKLLDIEGERFTEMAIPLVMGHLVHITCKRAGTPHSNAQKECFKTLAKEYIDKLWSRYQSAASKEEKLMILGALQNIKFGGIYDTVKGLINDPNEDPQIRAGAMWAASLELMFTERGVCHNIPIFADPSYPAEMRIFALEQIFWSKPKPADLNTIVTILYREKNYEVLNYAVALLERWANNISPCAEETGHLARYYLKYMKQWSGYQTDFGFGVSKTYARHFQKKNYGYGGSTVVYVIGSEDSTTPLALGMGIGGNMMNNYMQMLVSVHIRLEGVAKGLVRKFKETDPSTWKIDNLKSILSGEMGIRERPDQPIRAQVTINLKGQTVFMRVYDETDGQEGGKFTSLLEKFKDLGETYSINHQRAVNLGSLLYEQPTAIGMPLAVMSSITSMASIRATVKRGNHRGLLYRDIEYSIKTLTQAVRGTFVMNPFRKAAWGVVNSRLYHLRAPRNILIGVNVVKKELKLTVSRPSRDNPFKIFIHSQTSLMVRSGNLKGDYEGLQTNCPSCNNVVLLTKGPDNVQSRVFIDRENTNRGSQIKGEYFDCELNINRGNTLGRLLYAYAPFNKSPKNLLTGFLMGQRQIRAFLFYFPKNEQCGASLTWSQSANNPVSEIEIALRVSTEANGERLFFRGRKILMKAIVKAKGEPVDRVYRINFAWEFTPGYIENKLKIQVNRNEVKELGMSSYTMCFMMENEYPEFPQEFMGLPDEDNLSVSGKALLQYGEGNSCTETEGEIRVNFEHSTTQEARDKLEEKWYYQQCREQKSSPGWAGRSSYGLPITEACYMTAHDASSARKYTWDIKFVKVTKRLEAWLTKLKTIGSAGMLPYWDVDPDDVSDSDGIGPFAKIDLTFKDDESMLDIDVETRRGSETFSNVPLRLDWTKRLRNLRFTRTLKRLMDNKIINPCIVNQAQIRTNDNVTIDYEPSSCWTLVSGNCGPNPNYAVFSKQVGGAKPLQAQVFIGGHQVELNGDSVTVNGASVDIDEDSSYTLTENSVDIVEIYRWGNTYNLYSFLRVWVAYDGNFLEVVPAPSTKGQHCGICGNYNRNKWDELTGKNNEQLTSVAEFVQSWQWKC